jgi:hypothetical protein
MRKREKRKKMLESKQPRRESKERNRSPGMDQYTKEKKQRARKRSKEGTKQKKRAKKGKKKEVLKEVTESDLRKLKL